MKKKWELFLYHFFTLIGGLIMIYPLIWMLMSSFKESGTIFNTAKQLIPKSFTIDNYIRGWQGFSGYKFSTFISNSFFVSVLVVIFTLVSSSVVAYGLARLRFPGNKFLFILVLITMMIPSEIMMIPQYLWYNHLNWINTYLPMTVPHLFAVNGFHIYLLINFIGGLPKELDQAALIDGCSYYSIFSRIVLPLMKPALGTVAIFSFIGGWNNYMGALLYLKSNAKYTISIALKLFCDPSSVSDYGSMFAMSIVSLIPIILIFIFLQRYLIEGISTQGLKG